jgi:hypothetical protein
MKKISRGARRGNRYIDGQSTGLGGAMTSARWNVILFAALVTVATAGCHHSTAERDAPVAPDGRVAIQVINHNVLDVIVYIAHSGYRTRLGTVTAKTNAEFAISLRSLGAGHEFMLIGEPIGGRAPVRSDSQHATDGDTVIWTLESEFQRSTLIIQ